MTDDQLNAFNDAIEADATLQKKLNAAKDLEAVVAIAKDAGFVISVDQLRKVRSGLSDESLSEVVGGMYYIPSKAFERAE